MQQQQQQQVPSTPSGTELPRIINVQQFAAAREPEVRYSFSPTGVHKHMFSVMPACQN
jgi:hypothetical protein